MLGALEGFAVIGFIIFVGFLLGRSGVLGAQGQRVLASTVFYVSTPALLYDLIAEAPLERIFSPAIFATAGSASLVGIALFTFSYFKHRSLGRAVMSGWAVSYVNIGNLGIPIAIYVLKSSSYVPPIMLFQLVILAPLGMVILDIHQAKHAGTLAHWWTPLLQVIRNPILIGAAVGLFFAITGLRLPPIIHDPVSMIGATSVPLTLLAFGISLKDGWAVPARGTRTDLTLITLVKLAVQPLIAWLIGGPLLGFTGVDLMAIVVTSALPTAQNVYVYSMRYRMAETLVRDAVFVTTILSFPTIVLLSALLS